MQDILPKGDSEYVATIMLIPIRQIRKERKETYQIRELTMALKFRPRIVA